MTAESPDADRAPATLRHVLVGVDRSEAAGVAALFGLWLADTAHAHVTLAHVCPESARVQYAAGHQRRPSFETADWRARLDALRDYAAADAAVDTLIAYGQAAGALIDEAATQHAELLLVGASAGGSIHDRLLGSTTRQIIDHAPCAVMVFREDRPLAPTHVSSIVVGLDGSKDADEALTVADDLAAIIGASLTLISVPMAGSLGERQAADLLEQARTKIAADVPVTIRVEEGRASQVLVDACPDPAGTLLVVGRRGIGGFTKLLLGGTAHWLAHHAACPVLIARSPLQTSRRPR